MSGMLARELEIDQRTTLTQCQETLDEDDEADQAESLTETMDLTGRIRAIRRYTLVI